MKNTLLAAAMASTLIIGVNAQAADVKVSGQVSRVLVVPDDAAGNELQFLDNGISESRFRIEASHDLGNGMQAGSRLEAQLQSNGGEANGGTFSDPDGNLDGDDSIDLTHQDIYLSGAFGKISLGKGDGAGNGSTEADLSGTYIIAGVNANDLYAGFLVNDDTRVASIYGEIDAYDRVNRVRYDTLDFNGLGFAVSYGQREVKEFAVRYSGGTDTQYQVRGFIGSIGESEQGLDTGNNTIGISGSVLLSSGFNLTASYSALDRDQFGAQNRENIWLKLGYKTGRHAFAVDYGETKDDSNNVATEDSEGETVGLSYVFAPVNAVELFVGYRKYTAEETTDVLLANADYTDVELVTFGSRVKF